MRSLPAILAAAALVLACAGGGGRDPRAALAWQVLAVLAAGLALRGLRRVGLVATLLTLLGVSAVVSALHAADPHASLLQALTWTCAVLPGCCLAARARNDGTQPGLRVALLGASIGVLALQVLAASGWALLGRAGATPGARPLGTFMDPNHLVETLVMIAAANASLAGFGGRARAHLGVTLACVIGVVLSGSRIGPIALLGLLVGEALRRGIGRRQRWSLRLGVAAGVLALLVLAGVVVGRRASESEAWSRPTIWRAAAEAAWERPMLGLGPGGYFQRWRAYNPPVERGIGRFALQATTPHGEWLRLPIDLGLAGTLLALAACVALARRAGPRDLLPVVLAAAPLLLVHDVFHCPAALAWLSAACAMRWVAATAPDPASEAAPRFSLGWALALAVALAAVVRVQVAQASRDRGDAGLGLALAMDPDDPESLRDLAALLAPQGRNLDARDLRVEAVLFEAQVRAPRSFGVAVDQARLASRELRDVAPDVATRLLVKRRYARALSLAPREEALHVEAGATVLSAGDARAAEPLLRQALDLEPNDARAHAFLALALERTGQEGEAAKHVGAMDRLLALERSGLSAYDRHLLEVEPALAAAVRAEVPARP